MKLLSLTLDRLDEAGVAGIYVLEHRETTIYVGKAEVSVGNRIMRHIQRAILPQEYLGKWLLLNNDPSSVRLDIVLAPSWADKQWFLDLESKMISRFCPVLNVQHNL